MNKIIDFSLTNQFKLLYIIPTSGNRIYHIWFKHDDEINIIGKIIQNKYNLKDFHFGILSSSCRVQKKYMPIPEHFKKQPDDFYHAYLKFETF